MLEEPAHRPVDAVASPCVRKCCLDDRDVCIGCFRSLAEILTWSDSGRAERLAILEAADRRAGDHRQRFYR